MADQVNPLGGLALGMAQTAQVLAATPSPAPAPTRTVDSKPKAKAEGPQKEGAPKESLAAAAKTVQDFFQRSATDLQFGVDKDTGTYYFKIIDPNTHETIRQVPSEEILTMAKRLREISNTKDVSGVLMDEQG